MCMGRMGIITSADEKRVAAAVDDAVAASQVFHREESGGRPRERPSGARGKELVTTSVVRAPKRAIGGLL